MPNEKKNPRHKFYFICRFLTSNNRKCHFTLSVPALKRGANRRKISMEGEIYASKSAINMQIIKQKSRVSAVAE
jgi:hypothetical protein